MKVFLKQCLIACGIPMMSVLGENLLFNSGFELGTNGWSVHSYFEDPCAFSTDFREFDAVKDVKYAGQKALCIYPMAGRKDTAVLSHDVPVTPETAYTFSFFAKAENPGTELHYYASACQFIPNKSAAGVKNSRDLGKKVVPLSNEWKRYTYTFRTKPGFTAYTVHFRLTGTATGKIWIDNAQLERGEKVSAYVPSAPVEAAVDMSDSLYEDNVPMSGTLKMISYNKDTPVDIMLSIDNLFDGSSQKLNGFRGVLKKGKETLQTFAVPTDLPYGSFGVSTSMRPRTTTPAFVRDWKLSPETIAFNRMQPGDSSYPSSAYFTRVRTPRKHSVAGFRIGTTGSYPFLGTSSAYGFNTQARWVRLAGGNIHRCWDCSIVNWRDLEPEPGKFDWKLLDRILDSVSQTGVDTLCVLGGNFANFGTLRVPHVPQWAMKRDLSGDPEGTLMPKSMYLATRYKGIRILRPNLQDWRNYVSAVVTHCKGKIQYYEILNEPNLYFPKVEYYMDYLKAASEEIRKADPDAKVLGLCATSDFDVNPNGFIGQCMAAGAGKYMDHLTIHPYAKLDNSSYPTQMQARRRLSQKLREQKYTGGLWNGENYYVIPSWQPHREFAERTLPEDIARHLIIDMGEGCSGSTPTHFQTLLSDWIRPFSASSSGPLKAKAFPDARFAALAGTAYMIAGAEPISKIDLPDGGMAYSFRNHGKYFTVIWNAVKPNEYRVTVPLQVKLYDMMSNPLTVQGNSLVLNSCPVYLEWSGKDIPQNFPMGTLSFNKK